jgi:hypothetical protein
VRSEKTTIITPMHEFSPGELTGQEATVKCESKILKKGIQEFFAKPFSRLSVCLSVSFTSSKSETRGCGKERKKGGAKKTHTGK